MYKSLFQKISSAIALATVVFYFLPFYALSCGGQELISMSGKDLTFGTTIQGQDVDPIYLMLLLLIIPAVIMIFSIIGGFVNDRLIGFYITNIILALGDGVLLGLLTIAVYASAEEEGLDVILKPGFYLEIVGIVLLIVINIVSLCVKAKKPKKGAAYRPGPQPGPAPRPMPGPGPQPGPAPRPMPGPGPQPGPGPRPMPGPGPQPGPVPRPMPGPGLQPGPAPRPMPGSGPQPGPAPRPMPGPGPQPGPAPRPMPGPVPQPGPGPMPGPVPQPGPGPIPGPVPQPGPAPVPNPEPVAPKPGLKVASNFSAGSAVDDTTIPKTTEPEDSAFKPAGDL